MEKKIPLIKNIFKKSNKTNFENYFSLEEIYVDFKNIFFQWNEYDFAIKTLFLIFEINCSH